MKQPSRPLVNPPTFPVQNNQLGKNNSFQIKQYQGVIHDPEMMEHYARIDSSFPDRLLKMAEKEGDHRRELEGKIASRSYWRDMGGLGTGFIVVAGVACLSYLFMIHGHATEGAWIACTVMVSLAGIFVLRKVSEKKKS